MTARSHTRTRRRQRRRLRIAWLRRQAALGRAVTRRPDRTTDEEHA